MAGLAADAAGRHPAAAYRRRTEFRQEVYRAALDHRTERLLVVRAVLAHAPAARPRPVATFASDSAPGALAQAALPLAARVRLPSRGSPDR